MKHDTHPVATRTAWILAGLLTCGCSPSGEPGKREPIRLHWDSRIQDLGRCVAGTERIASFRVTNPFSTPVALSVDSKSCECVEVQAVGSETSPVPSTGLVLAGLGATEIRLRLATGSARPGPNHWMVSGTWDAAEGLRRGTWQLEVMADVVPAVQIDVEAPDDVAYGDAYQAIIHLRSADGLLAVSGADAPADCDLVWPRIAAGSLGMSCRVRRSRDPGLQRIPLTLRIERAPDATTRLAETRTIELAYRVRAPFRLEPGGVVRVGKIEVGGRWTTAIGITREERWPEDGGFAVRTDQDSTAQPCAETDVTWNSDRELQVTVRGLRPGDIRTDLVVAAAGAPELTARLLLIGEVTTPPSAGR